MIGLNFTLEREIDIDTRCLYAVSYMTFSFLRYEKNFFIRKRFALRLKNDEDLYNQPTYVYNKHDENFLQKREEYIRKAR